MAIVLIFCVPSGQPAIRDDPGRNQVRRDGPRRQSPASDWHTIRRRAAMALLCCLMGAPAIADPGPPGRVRPLDPTTARVEFRAYAFGVLPIDGVFARFGGELTVDAPPGANCRIVLRIEVDSLEMADAAIRADMLSPNLLDANHFRQLAFTGVCRGGTIAGDLTLHGVTRPLTLALTTGSGGELVAEGSILRTEWDITGRPLLAGRTVRLRLTVRGGR